MSKNRNLFRLSRFILLRLPYLLKGAAKLRKPEKRLLLIKTDAIGDYLLFRNFLAALKQSPCYQGYRIDLLGNPLWLDLARTYDHPSVDAFYFEKAESLYYRPLALLILGWKLFRNRYQVVLQPSSTRTLMNDGLAAWATAPVTLGWLSDLEAISAKHKKKTDLFYSSLFSLPADELHELDRNRLFFEWVTQQSLGDIVPSLPVHPTAPRKGIVIVPGAGNPRRSWEAEKFAGLIQHLLERFDEPIYLAGGAVDKPLGEFLLDRLPADSVVNLIGTTSLLSFAELIAGARLVVTNETSAYHFAVAAETPSVCLLGGGHFNRFAPYPARIADRSVCIYEPMPCFHCNWICKFDIDPSEPTEKAPFPCLSAIGHDAVWQAVVQLLTAHTDV